MNEFKLFARFLGESSDSEESDVNSKTRTGEHSARDGNSSEESDDDEEVSSDVSV